MVMVRKNSAFRSRTFRSSRTQGLVDATQLDALQGTLLRLAWLMQHMAAVQLLLLRIAALARRELAVIGLSRSLGLEPSYLLATTSLTAGYSSVLSVDT